MVREVCEALEAMTTQAPLMVILEDLHWVRRFDVGLYLRVGPAP